MTASPYESRIRARLRDLLRSASHSFDHLDRVLAFARSLQATYGGDADVLVAAALLHDLGRSDPALHGVASVRKSVEDARGILQEIGFPADKTLAVLQAIGEHDQPDVRPSSLEGRILKDADFLSGFGATGIARIALWTGESGGTMDDLLQRLEVRMPARIASLEFEQSRAYATREYLFVRLFLDKLHADAPLPTLPAMPYVAVEGISGSGKSTQATLLMNRYREAGYAPVFVHEPTDWYREMKRGLGAAQHDRQSQLLLLLADRHLNVRTVLETTMRAGQPIVSDRSYLSSIVYQAEAGWLSAANVAYLHTFIPQPTHLFVLDLPAEEAMRRIAGREDTPRGDFETLDQLRKHRERFRSLVEFFPHLRVIDAENQSPEAVHAQIWDAVSTKAE